MKNIDDLAATIFNYFLEKLHYLGEEYEDQIQRIAYGEYSGSEGFELDEDKKF